MSCLRVAVFAAATTAVGCVPFSELDLEGAGYSSLVLFVDPPDGDPRSAHVRAIDLTAPRDDTLFSTPRDDTFMLLYPAALEQLGLAAGDLEYAERFGAPLPAPTEVRLASDARAPTEERPVALERFLFLPATPGACFAAGGCYANERAQACTRDCPVPPVPLPPSFERYPVLPKLTPCPSGWRERPAPPLVVCEPLPLDGVRCSPDEVAVPSSGCVRLGQACPPEDEPWARSLPEVTPIAYVREGAAGTTGTRSDPVGTLAEALALLPSGGLVALAGGRYTIDQELRSPISIVGACPSKTRLLGRLWTRGSATIANLTREAEVMSDGPGARVSFEGVDVVGGKPFWVIAGAQGQLENCRVGFLAPAGVGAKNGSSITIRASEVIGGAFGAAEQSVAVVEDTRGRGTAIFAATTGSLLRIERSVLEGVNQPIQAGMGARVEVRDLVARGNTVPLTTAVSELVLERAFLEDSIGIGVFVAGSTTAPAWSGAITVSDLVIKGVHSTPDGAGAGVGLFCPRCPAQIQRVWVEGVAGVGINLAGPTEGTNLVVRGSIGDFASAWPPTGVVVSAAHVNLDRFVSEHNEGTGLALYMTAATAVSSTVATRVTLTNAQIIENGTFGVSQGKTSTLIGDRIKLVNNGGAEWFIKEALSHSSVTNLSIEDGPEPEGTCTSQERCPRVAIALPMTPQEPPGEHSISRFSITTSALHAAGSIGILVGGHARLNMADGAITGFATGAQFLQPQARLGSALTRVRLEGNDVPLDAPHF